MLLTLTFIAGAALCGWIVGAVTVAKRAYKRGSDAAWAECLDIAMASIAKRDAAKRAEAHAAGD